MSLRLRELTEEEYKALERMIQARSTPVGKLKRAQIIWLFLLKLEALITRMEKLPA